MATLLDSLTSFAAPAIGQIAEQLGESDASVSRGVTTSIASVLGGLVTKTKDPSFAGPIFDLIISRPASTNLTKEVQSMVGGLGPGAATSGVAGSLLDMLFGGRTKAVGDLIARTAGFKNSASGTSLLAVAVPLVLGFLGKSVRDNGFNVGGLVSMLGGERESILAATPAGVMNLVDTGGALPHVEMGDALRSVSASGREYGAAKVPGRNRWFLPLIAVAAVAVAWFITSRRPAPVFGPGMSTAASAIDSAAQKGGAAVKAAAGEVSDAVSSLGAFVKRGLPGGVELNIPERGIESKLIAFIENPSLQVNDTTWFDFDRLNFATGSATILPESREQLNNIVTILEAYPKVNVKVGGYTDNVGGASANLRLSRERANAVMRALIENGIPANRLQAEGYGEKHPVADNSTEEGRARNRRIALRVTKK